MAFSDFKFFVLPDALPNLSSLSMSREGGDTSSPGYDLELKEDEDWSHVNCLGEEVGPLSPATTPDDDENRMSKSLDFGHGSVGEDIATNSYPWESRSRTLEDSPRRSNSSVQYENLSAPNPENKETTGSESDKIKVKLMSAWNNMKFGMKPKTQFRTDSPIWYLGYCYDCIKPEYDELRHNGSDVKPADVAFESFRRDFISRIWFTYRKDFPKLYGSSLTTDVGWGCMLRSGQMMLAHALLLQFLGREWRWHSHQNKYETIFHHQVIKFFGDLPSEECPFSIHRLVQIGAEFGKKPGDWYGPASVAFVLREAIQRAPALNALLNQIGLYVAQDCTVYKQDVIDLCTRTSSHRSNSNHASSHSPGGATVSSEDPWRAVIVLIPVRLGGEVLNPIYIPCVKSMLAHDMCIGIIGGRPKHSLYFVGWQDDKLIYLDPHLCQETVNVSERNFALQTFHCMSPRKMAFTKMDPSCTIGFYCKTRADFIKFVKEANQMAAPPKEKGLYPLFVFEEGRGCDLMNNPTFDPQEDRYLRIRKLDRKGRPKGTHKESDDFVFL